MRPRAAMIRAMKLSLVSADVPPSLRRSLRLVTLGGCLAMVHSTGTTCPALAEFLRAAGAQDIHFGLLSGVPMFMVFMQFIGAAITNRIRRRKAPFMILLILARFLYLPFVFIPVLYPELSTTAKITILIALLTLSRGLIDLVPCLWYSWMADLIPRRVLNSYWGIRQRWMYATWAASYLGVFLFTLLTKNKPITDTFPILITIAVAAGVVDILLFLRVDEPPNTIATGKPAHHFLLAPLRDTVYRTFVGFSCVWAFTASFGAVFMQLYVLEKLEVPLAQTVLIWCLSGVGTALSSKWWGRTADKHGHRPVLTTCLTFKPIIILAMLLVGPRTAPWILPIVFLIDGVWNGGLLVATNGYIMKLSPRENRSMFVAVLSGPSAVCSGLGAISAGFFLHANADFSHHVLGRDWNNYHLLFLISLALRVTCAFLAHGIREPKSSRTVHVFADLLDRWPTRFLRFPVRLYSRTDGPAPSTPRDGTAYEGE